jgi:translation initiation factor eIF-2B subunit gamma
MQVVNSVVMNHVTIGDFCSIQGSVICSNVQLQERAILKDCQVICVSFSQFSRYFS